MAIELASTYVSVGLSTDGLHKQIEKAFGDAGGKASGAFGKKFDPDKAGVGKKFGKIAKIGVGAVGAIGAAVGGLALKGGMERALKIEGAQAKLKGLGHDAASVEKIMANSLAAVKGTAFGLDAAAGTAAGAVAAGIKPGQQLEKVLKSVANASAATGSTMEEMGGIFNKVASVGKAQNDVLQQVAERGLPIYAALGEELGKTSEEVFKMASKGEIDFATFEKAMTRAAGTVADEMGNTLPGKIDNAKAAMSRMGAAAVSSFLPMVSSGVSGVTDVFDKLTPAVERGGKMVADVFASAQRSVSAFIKSGDIQARLQGISQAARDLGGGFLEGFGGLDRLKGVAADLLPAVTGPLGLLKDTFKDVFTGLDFGAIGKQLGSTLGPILSSVAGLAGKVGESLGKIAAGVLPVVKDGFAKMKPSIDAVVKAFAPFVGAIQRLIGFVTPILVPAFKFLAAVLMDSLKGAIDGISWVLDGLTKTLNGIMDFISNIFTGNWTAAWEGIKNALFGVIEAIAGGIWTWMNVTVVNAVRGGIAKVAGYFTGGWASIKSIFTSALEGIKGLVTGAWNAIKSNSVGIWNGIKGTLTGIWNGLKATVMGVMNAMKGGISGVWNGIKSLASDIWGGIKSTISKTVGDLKSGVEGAFTTMKDNIGRIWDGVKAAVKAPIKFVVETVINKGLIGSFNWLMDKIGLGNLAIGAVALPEGFADGGWTGPGSKHTPAGIVHADEHVWTKEEMRKFPGGHKRMEQMRAAVRRGERDFGMAGYASGGRVRAPFSGGSWNGGRYRSGKYHGGVDFPRPVGTAVRAAEDGEVISARHMATSYGIHAIIRGVWDMIYAHMSRMLVSQGQRVKQGQTIGAVGSTGNSTGPHLHWEVRPRGAGHGSAVNPLAVASGALAGDAGAVAAEESPLDKLKGILSGTAKKLFDIGKAAVGYVTEFLKDPMGHITALFTKALQPSGGGGIVGQIVDAIPGKVADALKQYAKSIIGFAGGTTSAPPGLAWVGERGPELVRFRGGERVWSNSESVRMAAQPSQTQVRIELVDERIRGLIRAEVCQMKREGWWRHE